MLVIAIYAGAAATTSTIYMDWSQKQINFCERQRCAATANNIDRRTTTTIACYPELNWWPFSNRCIKIMYAWYCSQMQLSYIKTTIKWPGNGIRMKLKCMRTRTVHDTAKSHGCHNSKRQSAPANRARGPRPNCDLLCRASQIEFHE